LRLKIYGETRKESHKLK